MGFFEGANVNIHGPVKHTVVHGNQTVFMHDNSVKVLGNHNHLQLSSPPGTRTRPSFGSQSQYSSPHLAHQMLENRPNAYPTARDVNSGVSTHQLPRPSRSGRNPPLLLSANSQEITPTRQGIQASPPTLPTMHGPSLNSLNASSPYLSFVPSGHDTLSPTATLAHPGYSSSLSVTASVTELESTESIQPSATSTALASASCSEDGASSLDQPTKFVINPPVKCQKWWKWKRWFPKENAPNSSI